MITFDKILKIVTDFYSIATHDFMIGYHFRKIEDFDEHLPRIANFWFLQLNGKAFEAVAPPFDLLNKHKSLRIKKGEIYRWMTLFEETIDKSNLSDEEAKLWKEKAAFFKEKIENFVL